MDSAGGWERVVRLMTACDLDTRYSLSGLEPSPLYTSVSASVTGGAGRTRVTSFDFWFFESTHHQMPQSLVSRKQHCRGSCRCPWYLSCRDVARRSCRCILVAEPSLGRVDMVS